MIVVTSALELLLGSSRNTVLFTFAKHYGQKEPVSTILSQAWDRPVGRGVISREWSSGLGGGGGGGGGGGRGSSGGGRRVALPAVLGASTQACPLYLTKYIRQGWANDPVEVVKLQRFLREFEGFSNLAITGIYDGPTFNAVAVFQVRYSRDVLGPWGITYPTGFVFITTRLAINNIYCARSTATNLDLRHVYDNYRVGPYAVSAESGGQESDDESTGTTSLGVAGTSSTSTLAAIGAADILKLTSDWWLIILLLLAIITLAYFIWKLRPEPEAGNPPRSPPDDGEEVIIEETEDEDVEDQLPLDKLK
ncbi:MAG: peptidoglycan-binding protein [Candidatus Vogelbacteria bacterium]|nr:peptidoglycan-binding protein [Candidatus Vogelbacteria bacterium]